MDRDNYTDRAASLFFRFKETMQRILPSGSGKIFSVLGGLHEFERRHGRPLTISEMARFSGLAVPNVSRLLKPFEEKDLVKKVKHGRKVSIVLTEKGKNVLAQSGQKFIANIADAICALSESERAAFLTSSEKILDYLERKEETKMQENIDA